MALEPGHRSGFANLNGLERRTKEARLRADAAFEKASQVGKIAEELLDRIHELESRPRGPGRPRRQANGN